jgi:hypothetical protein
MSTLAWINVGALLVAIAAGLTLGWMLNRESRRDRDHARPSTNERRRRWFR